MEAAKPPGSGLKSLTTSFLPHSLGEIESWACPNARNGEWIPPLTSLQEAANNLWPCLI